MKSGLVPVKCVTLDLTVLSLWRKNARGVMCSNGGLNAGDEGGRLEREILGRQSKTL